MLKPVPPRKECASFIKEIYDLGDLTQHAGIIKFLLNVAIVRTIMDSRQPAKAT